MGTNVNYFLLAAAVAVTACTSSDDAKRAAENAGFANVVIESEHRLSPRWSAGCGEGDSVGFNGHGTNAQGKRVALHVCCGDVGKACTVRF